MKKTIYNVISNGVTPYVTNEEAVKLYSSMVARNEKTSLTEAAQLTAKALAVLNKLETKNDIPA